MPVVTEWMGFGNMRHLSGHTWKSGGREYHLSGREKTFASCATESVLKARGVHSYKADYRLRGEKGVHPPPIKNIYKSSEPNRWSPKDWVPSARRWGRILLFNAKRSHAQGNSKPAFLKTTLLHHRRMGKD